MMNEEHFSEKLEMKALQELSSLVPSVFISRELKSDSIFFKKLSEVGFYVYGESLITFQAVPFDTIPVADWIFFYSKKAVFFFFENIKKEELKIPKAKFGTIGEGTANKLKDFGITAQFVGTGKPESTAALFSTKAKGKKVLFPRAKNSRKSIQKLLPNQIDTIDLIVYNNQPKSDLNLPFFDYLVFTSPMNVEAYFSVYDWKKGQKIVAIGETTAGSLNALGISEVLVAERPSERALVDVIINNFLKR